MTSLKHVKVGFLTKALALVTTLAFSGAYGESLESAKITRITNKVDIVVAGKSPVPATVGEIIQGSTGVKTEANSRTELMFPDQTLARLGANTLFSFESGTRNVELKNGILLLQVPKNAGGAKITTAPVTAAITGTTILVQYDPKNKNSFSLTVVEGSVKLSSNSNASTVTIGPGKTISYSSDTNKFSVPQNANIGELMKSSNLLKAGPLGNKDEINAVLALQEQLKAQGIILELIETDSNNDPSANEAVFGGVNTNGGTLVPSGVGTASSGAGAPGNLGNQTSL
ncbi:MAG: FecR family protein [Chthoniobacterales bacterium]